MHRKTLSTSRLTRVSRDCSMGAVGLKTLFAGATFALKNSKRHRIKRFTQLRPDLFFFGFCVHCLLGAFTRPDGGVAKLGQMCSVQGAVPLWVRGFKSPPLHLTIKGGTNGSPYSGRLYPLLLNSQNKFEGARSRPLQGDASPGATVPNPTPSTIFFTYRICTISRILCGWQNNAR